MLSQGGWKWFALRHDYSSRRSYLFNQTAIFIHKKLSVVVWKSLTVVTWVNWNLRFIMAGAIVVLNDTKQTRVNLTHSSRFDP